MERCSSTSWCCGARRETSWRSNSRSSGSANGRGNCVNCYGEGITSTELSPASDRVWSVIEREKRRDTLARRVSITAWSVTAGAVLAFGGVTAVEVWQLARYVI